MAMRLSGLMSGMDTESIVQQLVEARKTKVTTAVKAQKTIQYQQEAWKSLNTQILNLYNKSLSNLRFESSFIKKTTKVSNSNIVSVITGENAMNSVQSLEVSKLAQSGFLTGGQLGPAKVTEDGVEKEVDATSKTTLGELGFTSGSGNIRVKTSDGVTNIAINENTTIDSFITSLKNAGLSANFDETNGRIYIAAKSSGTKNDFSIMADDAAGWDALTKLGLDYKDSSAGEYYEDILGINDSNRASFNLQTKISTEQQDTLDQLKTSRQDLLDKKNDLTTDQSALLGKIGNLYSNNSTFQTAWDDALFEAGATFAVGDYDSLTDEQKEIYNNALNKALEAAKADVALTDADKAELEELQSDWKTNLSELKSTEASLATVEKDLKFADDGTVVGLSDAKADAIEKKYTDAYTMYQAWNGLTDGGCAGQKTKAEDAEIKLNGVTYTSDKNTFAINGLTLTVSATTSDPVTITTEDDTDGIYDMIKNFFTEYNTLINQMDKLYNADSADGYEPLTDEEKSAMSDSAVEEWEKKIKDAILRKDSTLSTFSGALKKIMMQGVEVNGKMMYLSNFGINTLNYFTSAANEKNAYHIDGDPDDSETSGNADKLKTMIANDPDTVVSFFTQLAKNLYNEMFEQMKGREGYSSAMTVYDDKKLQSDYDDYTTKIKELEDKLADYEDKWYAKFAAMETALAKMQNNASAVTALLGG